MANAIVVLTTGERVITNLQEVRENEEDTRAVCLAMERPYILFMERTENENKPNQEIQVRFAKWCPYSSDTVFKIPFSSVISVGEVDQGLAEAYDRTIKQAIEFEQTNKVVRVEQNDPGQVESEEELDDQATEI